MFDIITDSACDLTLDTAKQLGIEVVPFYVSLDGEHYRKEGWRSLCGTFISSWWIIRRLPKTQSGLHRGL